VDDQIEVEEPHASATDEFAPQDPDAVAAAPAAEADPVANGSATGRRSAGGRSSRRSTKPNTRASASPKVSARASAKQLTPEELAKRSAGRKQAMGIILGILAGVLVAVGVWWFAIRIPPRVNIATQTLARVEVLMANIESGVTTLRDPAAANKAREEAIALLEGSAELGYAKKDADPRDPKLASIELARKAADYKEALVGTWKARVEQVERDVRVETNKRKVLAGFAALLTAKDEELVNFEREVNNFLDNPVLPGAGRSDEYVKEYNDDLTPVRTQRNAIDQEKERRDRAITDLPVREARGLAAIAVQKEQFQEALSQVDELARKYPTANFDGVRAYVRDSAKLAWETALAAAEENYKTFTAPGTTKDMADKSLEAARTRMQQVIDHFGLDEYVNQAKEALQRFKAKD
jgi:hypothetical protein